DVQGGALQIGPAARLEIDRVPPRRVMLGVPARQRDVVPVIHADAIVAERGCERDSVDREGGERQPQLCARAGRRPFLTHAPRSLPRSLTRKAPTAGTRPRTAPIAPRAQ